MKTFHTITGTVQPGRGRGKILGFPTANLSCDLPARTLKEGVYASWASVDGRTMPALAFFGAARTFGEHEIRLEVYIFDFSEELYERKLTVTLLKKLRSNKRFASEKDLIVQMRKDEQNGRLFFSRYKT